MGRIMGTDTGKRGPRGGGREESEGMVWDMCGRT